MTNKEKFKEIFGYEAITDECPIHCISNVDGKCPYNIGTSDVCSTGYWWDAEYKEPTTKNDLGVDCVSRKEVFETIDDCNSDGLKGIFCSYDDGERFKEYIKNLPPVTPQEPILDKIRAEIKALTSNRGFLSCGVDYIHEEIDVVFDKYKVDKEQET